MKAIPFIDTMLNEEYRKFILQPFDQGMIESLFKNWKSKDMIGWIKHNSTVNDFTIEMYGKDALYKIKNPQLLLNEILAFPYPKTVDEFICDCYKSSLPLHWNENIIDSMNRIYFMKQTEIENYNTELLTKIEKI